MMQPSEASTQEPRTEQVNVKVTKTEKQALRFVSSALNVSEAELVHSRIIPGIVEEAERMRAKLADVA